MLQAFQRYNSGSRTPVVLSPKPYISRFSGGERTASPFYILISPDDVTAISRIAGLTPPKKMFKAGKTSGNHGGGET